MNDSAVALNALKHSMTLWEEMRPYEARRKEEVCTDEEQCSTYILNAEKQSLHLILD